VSNAFGGVVAHPERTRLMMCCAKSVVRGTTGSISLNQLDGLAIGENVHRLRHRSVHCRPKIVVALRQAERYQCAPDTVLVCNQVKIDATRMRRQIVEVCCGYLANTSDRDGHLCVR